MLEYIDKMKETDKIERKTTLGEAAVTDELYITKRNIDRAGAHIIRSVGYFIEFETTSACWVVGTK